MTNRSYLHGFSILEVFIAVTVSLILLGGVLQVFLSTRNSYALQNGYFQLQENGRFIEEYVSRIIRLAGYRSPPLASNNFLPLISVYPTATPFISGTNGTGINGSDTLIVRYQGSGNGTGTPDGTVLDCLNNGVDSNTMVTNTFSINSNNQLQCQSQNANASPSSQTQVLVSNVENMQVLYGEDTDGDGIANRYVPINFPYITIANIVSTRISVVLRSTTTVNTVPLSVTYNLLGIAYTPTATNYLHDQVTFTVMLRNLTPNQT